MNVLDRTFQGMSVSRSLWNRAINLQGQHGRKELQTAALQRRRGSQAVSRQLEKQPVNARYGLLDAACCDRDIATKSTKARTRAAN